MNKGQIFLDTAFVQALINPRDQFYVLANKLEARMQTATVVWVTEAVLIEIGDALSALDRAAAIRFINRCYSSSKISVVKIDTDLLKRGLSLYESRSDKNWGLTDCISFVVMQNKSLTEALTSDRHFIQAGFTALMLENT